MRILLATRFGPLSETALARLEALTDAQLSAAAGEAVARLAAGGLSAADVAKLKQVTYQVADLSRTGALGLTGLGTSVVTLDATAQGKGWSASGYDLVTVVMHELMHVLGQDDLRDSAAIEQSVRPGTSHNR